MTWHSPHLTPPDQDLLLDRYIEAASLFSLAILLLCVSLPHLSEGIGRITRSSPATSWMMAIVFDLAQIVAEVGLLLIPLIHLERKRVVLACRSVIVCCTAMSIALNIDAFLLEAEGLKAMILAVIWGCLLPLGVLTLFFLGSAFILCNATEGDHT